MNEFPREIATFQEVGASRLANTGVSKSTLFPQQLLFKDCSEDFLEQLCKQLQRKIIFPGQTIVDESAESQESQARLGYHSRKRPHTFCRLQYTYLCFNQKKASTLPPGYGAGPVTRFQH